MNKTGRDKRLFFDLNHPADFHFFKNLFIGLKERGYSFKVQARDKECLQDLLQSHQIPFYSRGSGSHSLPGKYFYAIKVLITTLCRLIRFRPGLTINLSSPYLILVSRFLGIPTLCYDDTDINPRLLPLIRRANHIFSPSNYPYRFHDEHFLLPAFKELAYLHPKYFDHREVGEGIFFRLTRTDSVHHSSGSRIDLSDILKKISKFSTDHRCFLSSEVSLDPVITDEVEMANRIRIHEDLQKCRVFWGNSATMAAEAAVLGIPAIFVGAEKFSYVKELEEYGLLFHFHPDHIASSFEKLHELLGEPMGKYVKIHQKMLMEKMDITSFLSWFIEDYPGSARTMAADPGTPSRFMF